MPKQMKNDFSQCLAKIKNVYTFLIQQENCLLGSIGVKFCVNKAVLIALHITLETLTMHRLTLCQHQTQTA